MAAPKLAPSRIVIEHVEPSVDGGQRPIKRVEGEPVQVEATIYGDGHDHLWCVVAHTAPGATRVELIPMVPSSPGLDRWTATFVPLTRGIHQFRIVAWIDHVDTWQAATRAKLEAGLDVASELLEGVALLEAAAARVPKKDRGPLLDAAERLRVGDTAAITDDAPRRPSMVDLARDTLKLKTAATSATLTVDVERERALFSSWYELFPRSWGPAEGVHGTLRDVEKHLGYVADMGFDVLYLAPIHPIGSSFRKGPNNAAVAGADDPGSPWGIGSEAGGHTAIHPALGTMDDFRSLVASATANGLELALDIALQTSPEHPWVTEHPAWFKHRPDGTIQYAENPPKKYQDIYPLDFESDDWRGLWDACLDIFRFWAAEGVRIFRVDNPHTKPFPFWEWLIGEVRALHPDTLFLAEAFTRPAVMQRLAAVGFSQSYSYFPWRVTKHELTEYFTELSTPPSVDCLRPSCWPNTPDILAWHLMDAPRTTFALRAFLAALLSPSYGVYGPAYELGDNRAAGNGKEEYLDSEKYQLRWWDRNDPDSLRGLLAELNRIRHEHLALHTLRTVRFHPVDNDQLLCFSKTTYEGPSTDPADRPRATMLVVANLDAEHEQHGTVSLDLDALGVDGARPYEVHDVLCDRSFTWTGPVNYVELHPDVQPGHVFRVTQT
jgi:starch synthase (maltosyl-transferring)